MSDQNIKWYIGVDEVGRGPLAGPITVCAVAFKTRNPDSLSEIKDSKKLSEKRRGDWLLEIDNLKYSGDVCYGIASSDNNTIDNLGLTASINIAIKESLDALNIEPHECVVLLDGGLKAPSEYIFQETIIKGDEKESIIAAASIIAKVHRDNLITELSQVYPEYGFEKHKGYGTKLHYEAIAKHGASKIHRMSFLKKFYDKIDE